MAKEKVMFRDLTIKPTKGRKPIILNKLLITLEKKVTVESSHTSLDSDQIIIKISQFLIIIQGAHLADDCKTRLVVSLKWGYLHTLSPMNDIFLP